MPIAGNMLMVAVDEIETRAFKNRFGSTDFFEQRFARVNGKWNCKFQSMKHVTEAEAEVFGCETRKESLLKSILIFIKNHKKELNEEAGI